MKANKIIRLYLILTCFSWLASAFIDGIYYVHVSKYLKPIDISFLNMAYYLALFIFEIPAGIFADLYGRKLSFIGSSFFSALGYFVYMFAESFWWFFLGDACWGVSVAFMGSAFRAWLVDSLQMVGHTDNLRSVFAREQQIINLSRILGISLGGVISYFGNFWPWLISGIISILNALLALHYMIECLGERPGITKVRQELMNSFSVISQIFTKKEASSKMLKLFFIAIFAYSFLLQIPIWQWQNLSGINEDSLISSLIISFFSIVVLLGSLFSDKVSKYSQNSRLLFILIAILGFLVFLGGFGDKSFVVLSVCLVIIQLLRGFYEPLMSSFINEQIGSQYRATILGVAALFEDSGACLGVFCGGVMANIFLPAPWFVSGGVVMVVMIFFASSKN